MIKFYNFHNILVVITVVLVINLEIVTSEKELTTKEISTKCADANPKYVKTAKCELKEFYNSTTHSYNYDIELQPGVVLDELHAQIRGYHQENDKFVPLNITFEINICRYLIGDPELVEFWGKLYSEENNVDKGCPLKDRLFIRDMTIPMTNGPPELVSEGIWRLDIDLLMKRQTDPNVQLITIEIFFEILEKSLKIM